MSQAQASIPSSDAHFFLCGCSGHSDSWSSQPSAKLELVMTKKWADMMGSTPWLCLLIVVLLFLERSLADRVISLFKWFCPTKSWVERTSYDESKYNKPHTYGAHRAYRGAQSNHQVFSSSTQKVELISVPLIGITATPPVYGLKAEWIFIPV